MLALVAIPLYRQRSSSHAGRFTASHTNPAREITHEVVMHLSGILRIGNVGPQRIERPGSSQRMAVDWRKQDIRKRFET